MGFEQNHRSTATLLTGNYNRITIVKQHLSMRLNYKLLPSDFVETLLYTSLCWQLFSRFCLKLWNTRTQPTDLSYFESLGFSWKAATNIGMCPLECLQSQKALIYKLINLVIRFLLSKGASRLCPMLNILLSSIQKHCNCVFQQIVLY